MNANPFAEWLQDIADEPVSVQPGDINAEAQENLRWFSLSAELAAVVTAADVEAFASKVADARRRWLSLHQATPMVLYWWHDRQAGQLRFSLVSAVHGRLPFGAHVILAINLRTIAEEWLKSPYLDGIPWAELRSPASREDETAAPNLPVWSLRLP